jgi:hypothetical protein
MGKDQPQYLEIGLRLQALRLAYGEDMPQKAWAESHAFNATQYNNWESGVRRIPVDQAEKLADRYQLTLDWIYLSKRAGLSETSLKRLRPHLPK